MTAETTGRDVLREFVDVRIRRKSYGNLARDIGVSGDALIAFAGGGDLPVAMLAKLATEMTNGHGRYDPKLDRLVPVQSEVKALGVAPPPHDPERPGLYPESIGPWTRGKLGDLPPSPQTPAPSAKKPGWA
jgi:hypothetical protein